MFERNERSEEPCIRTGDLMKLGEQDAKAHNCRVNQAFIALDFWCKPKCEKIRTPRGFNVNVQRSTFMLLEGRPAISTKPHWWKIDLSLLANCTQRL